MIFMNFTLCNTCFNNNFIIKNYDNFLNSENTFYDYYNYKFYDYYINNYSEKDKEYIFSTLENFLKGMIIF